MRILHVSSEYPPQQVFGLGRYVSDLSRKLVQQGHDVHVLTNSIGGQDQDVREEGVAIHRVDYPPPPKPPSKGGPIMAYNLHLLQRSYVLGKEALGNPEVIVSHDWLTSLAAGRLARRWNLPHVWTVHDTVWGKRGGNIEDPEDVLAFQLEGWAARSADLILVNSTAIGREVGAHYAGDRRKMELLHPGLDPERFATLPSPARREAFRSLFSEPEDLLITYGGRLDLEKGLDTLINAFSILKTRIPKARLAIAGSGRLKPVIEDHIRKLGLEDSVELPGYLEGEVLLYFYHASDIHVCPSHYEPFGLVAAEAMAMGTPTVVSATGGLVDIVTTNEVGRIFPPRDPGQLAEVLLALGHDPDLRKRLGEKGRDHVLGSFSWSSLATRAITLYSKVLRGGRAA
jgi:glycogen(starch) synthase